jgi:apolipoprotein D and lipocalin family protein
MTSLPLSVTLFLGRTQKMPVSIGPRVLSFILLPSALMVLFSCATGTMQSPPLEVVSHVDLNKYVGTWYEIARFPHRFQDGCVGSRATYTLLEGGKIGVLNQCYKGSLEGKLSSAKGKAWVVDKETHAKLKVSFFWPFTGDYWIIDLEENYEYAVVGHPSRNYLWVLSRTQEMDEAVYRRILDRVQKQGYDTSKLIKPTQKKAL